MHALLRCHWHWGCFHASGSVPALPSTTGLAYALCSHRCGLRRMTRHTRHAASSSQPADDCATRAATVCAYIWHGRTATAMQLQHDYTSASGHRVTYGMGELQQQCNCNTTTRSHPASGHRVGNVGALGAFHSQPCSRTPLLTVTRTAANMASDFTASLAQSAVDDCHSAAITRA